ncbi:MAG: PfkB family carbohydrate kinase [Planctomycetota bacterium]
MSLIVTGTISIDTVYTPEGGHREAVLGGSCAYFAAAASHYGPVRLVAAVGDDFPEALDGTLAKFTNIDASGLERRSGSKTFRWGGKYMEDVNQRETLFTELGVLEEAPPPVPEHFKDSAYLFLANSHPGVQMGMLESLPNVELSVVDTMDLWINVAREDLARLLARVDGLVLNNEEAELYTGKRNPITAGKKILEEGPTFVVVKKGEHGALLIHRDGIAALPAFPAEEVVDPTGAGDTFAGGMMAHIAKTGDTSFEGIRAAMAHGTVIASFTIETFSLDRLSELNQDRIQARYEEFARMTRIG